MKYVISLFWSLSAFSAPVRVFHESRPENAKIVQNIFSQRYKIPEDLIEKKEVQNCESLTRPGNLDLCIKNNGDLLVVSVNRRFVTESLKIFYAP